MALPEIKKEALVQILNVAAPVHTLAMVDTAADIPDEILPHIGAMLMTMQDVEFMASFDWQEEFKDRQADLDSIEVVENADLETLRKIMTAHVRIDRFSDGNHLSDLIKSGYWAACLNRLHALSEKM